MNKRFFVFFCIILFTFLFGYLENFSGSYINSLNTNKMIVLNTIQDFRKDCNKDEDKIICTDLYLINASIVDNYEYLGIGYILSSLRIYCSENFEKSLNIEDPKDPGKLYDLVNTYNVINLKSLNCEKDIIIEAWSPKVTRRSGYQKGQLVAGNYESLSKVKRLSELASRDVYILIFLALLLIMLAKSILKIDFIEEDLIVFYSSIIIVMIKLFFAANIYSYILPFSLPSNSVNKIVFVFSTFTHLNIIFKSLMIEKLTSYRKLLSITFILLLLNVTLLEKWSYLFYIIYPSMILILFYISIKKDQILYLYYNIFLLSSFLKVSGVHIMPNARIVNFSYFIIIFILLYRQFFKYYTKYLQFRRSSNFENKNILDYINEIDVISKKHKELIHDLKSPLSVLKYSQDDKEMVLLATTRINELLTTNENKLNDHVSLKSHVNSIIQEKKTLNQINYIYKIQDDIKIYKYDTMKIKRILSNIIDNAIEASRHNEISVEITKKDENIEFLIKNNSKIAYEILNKLNSGESFTTKSYGSGIGASSSFSIIKQLKGSIKYYQNGEVSIKIPLNN